MRYRKPRCAQVDGALRFGLPPLHILLCHVKCKSLRSARTSAYHPAMIPERLDAATERSGRFGPLPDEALDALVVVLDEIRFGRSRSRSELVTRTGLGRAIVAQRVGELIERGLVTEGDVGPAQHGRAPATAADIPGPSGYILVADLGATSIDVAVTTLDGRILGHHDSRSHRGRTRSGARPGRRPVRRARPDDAGTARPAVGNRHRRPGPGRVRVRTADLASDHAGLGWLSDPRAVRCALRRPGLGRQRRQRPGARGVAVRRRGGSRERRRRKIGTGIGGEIISGSSFSIAGAGERRRLGTSRSRTIRRSCAAAGTSAASRRSLVVRPWAGRVRPPPRRAGARDCRPRSSSGAW